MRDFEFADETVWNREQRSAPLTANNCVREERVRLVARGTWMFCNAFVGTVSVLIEADKGTQAGPPR
jgi:hypothetical protein